MSGYGESVTTEEADLKVPVALTIAGSDPGGGAGIQQDIKVFTVLRVYSCAVITALTVQNTEGVKRVVPVDAGILKEQTEAVLEDIHPDVIKIGMLATRENVETVSGILKHHPDIFVIADPVILSKNGKALLEGPGISEYVEMLFPCIDLLTPNLHEAASLLGIDVAGFDDMKAASLRLCSLMGRNRSSLFPPAVLLKGGHLGEDGTAPDVLCCREELCIFRSERVSNLHTHGTGCTLSSAVAGYWAREHDLTRAVQRAKEFVSGAIRAGFPLGKGTGPVNPLIFLK